MDMKERAKEIENAVKLGNFAEVRKLIDDITDVNIIRSIEDNFLDRDPLVCAIHCREENIALYLVEKGFNHRLVYNYPGRECDQWCYYEHGDDPCPTEYDALDVASNKRLRKVHKVISEIRSGHRKPGDGLALMQNPGYKREDSAMSNKKVRGLSAGDVHSTNTKGGLARRKVKEFGVHYLSRNGESVIHMCDSAAMVHVCANMGVAINTANFDGDTALHLAVRKGQRDVCQALLMNGADPTQKNKLGQSAFDETNGSTRDILEKFKPGLVQVVTKGEYNSLQRLIRLWCNPCSKISKDGSKSAMEILDIMKNKSEQHTRTRSILSAHCKTLEVTHSVLSEDIPSLKKLLRTQTGWALNKRFKGGIGETLVSCAIDQHNLQVVQLLVESGKCNLNLRVREQEEPECKESVPILFKTLEESCPEEIWSYIDYNVDCFQTGEKDMLGNTAILRALTNGCSAKFIRRFIKRHEQTCLTERNKEGLNVRELAKELNRADVVQTIDFFIDSMASIFFLTQFPVEFYGLENLPYSEKVQALMPREKYKAIETKGVALHEAASRGDVEAIRHYNDANYRDKNGYTALIRAVVCNQLKVAETLITERPVLKSLPDNSNRYPLHYAYALPDEKGAPFVKLLLQRNPEDIEFKVDKDGREAAEYQDLRDTEEMEQMLRNVLTLDAYGQRIVPGALTNTPVSQHAGEIDVQEHED